MHAISGECQANRGMAPRFGRFFACRSRKLMSNEYLWLLYHVSSGALHWRSPVHASAWAKLMFPNLRHAAGVNLPVAERARVPLSTGSELLRVPLRVDFMLPLALR